MILIISSHSTEVTLPQSSGITPTVDVIHTELEPPREENTYRVTAYCSCPKCCGQYAKNRPLDANGREIVYGASGGVLVSGVSCASELPFGTKIDLTGYGTVIVQDRTARWVANKYPNTIDIYFSNHDEAIEFGCKQLKGVIINE
jgi:3D (Asp-Asp-Asp) domain-containing protein